LETARLPAIFCTLRFGRNFLPVLGFEVQARCGWLRVAALKRRRGVTPVLPRAFTCETSREAIMAMQVLTVRGIEALKPRTKRYEVFDG
jgi:hypothetical protein